MHEKGVFNEKYECNNLKGNVLCHAMNMQTFDLISYEGVPAMGIEKVGCFLWQHFT